MRTIERHPGELADGPVHFTDSREENIGLAQRATRLVKVHAHALHGTGLGEEFLSSSRRMSAQTSTKKELKCVRADPSPRR